VLGVHWVCWCVGGVLSVCWVGWCWCVLSVLGSVLVCVVEFWLNVVVFYYIFQYSVIDYSTTNYSVIIIP